MKLNYNDDNIDSQLQMWNYDMLLQGIAQFLQSRSSSFPSDDAGPRCRDFSALFQSLTSSSPRSLPPPRRDRFARWQTCVPADKAGRRRRWACRVESTFWREPAVNSPLINELKIKGIAMGGSGTVEKKDAKILFGQPTWGDESALKAVPDSRPGGFGLCYCCGRAAKGGGGAELAILSY